ncbi:hypothetical protein DF186_22480, partial [Enterococcus hirae]
PAAVMITGGMQGGDSGKDIIIISEMLLNDVNVEFLNLKKIGDVIELESSIQNKGNEVMQGFGVSEEGDSDRTVIQGCGTGG